MESNPKSLIQNAAAAPAPAQQAARQSISQLFNAFIDSQALRKRFDELLGKRAPQFISGLCQIVTSDKAMQEVFRDNPMSLINSALKVAAFDLPLEQSLGFAYIVAFRDRDKGMTATFVLGYKGMVQLALRTGAYSRVPDAVDVREGELVSYDRLTGDCEFRWIEDEAEREAAPIIGYAAYFRLKNGAEKTIYMSRAQVEAHEKKNRKGQYMGKGWRDDFDAMAKKTVLRRLISHYGLMSIDYQQGSEETVKLAEAVMNEEQPDVVMTIPETETETEVE